MKIKIILMAFVAAALIATVGCSSPTFRYIGYRLSPDRVDMRDIDLSSADIESPVTIYLDKYAVPHITASDEASLSFGIGYMHGRDRRFQLELLRLLSMGRLRELIGDQDTSGAVGRLEIINRMIDLGQDARSIIDNASKRDLAVFQAYADGVNAATKKEPTPMEFRLFDYQPADWAPMDTAYIAALISFGLSKNWEHELARLELIIHQLQTGETVERALTIWPPRLDLGPHLVGKKPETDPFADIPPVAPELVAYLIEHAKTASSASSALPEKLLCQNDEHPLSAFGKGGSRSNNWAMSGAWTKTGKGAFSSDPHMPHMLPSLAYLMHVKCDGCESGDYEIIGGVFMGFPAITFGTNGKVAWGPTSNWGDMTDLYVEKPAPGKPDHYLYQGKAEAFKTRVEVFRIRQKNGDFKEESKSVRMSRHGVILNDFIERLPDDFPLVALRRSPEKGQPVKAILNLYQSQNVTEARHALDDFFAMVGHWSLADSSGDIAYCGPMLLPRRTKHLGTIPVPGWTDAYEWDGFIPIKDLPWIENPPEGFLGTANNQVVQPESTGYPINFEGNVVHRWARIKQVLSSGVTGDAIARQIGDLQLDAVDMGVREVMSIYENALSRLSKNDDELIAEAAETLLAWDGDCMPEEIAPTLFNSLNAHLIRRTLEDEFSEATLEFIMSYFNIEPFVYGILSNPANPAWDDRRTDKKENADEIIEQAFIDTVDALTKRYGDDMEKWQWQKAAPFFIKHSFGGSKSLAKHLNRGPFPTRGAIDTVFKHQFDRSDSTQFPIHNGPVMRVMVDFNDLPGSRMVLPGGQSGRPSSQYYDDQIDMFMSGSGISMGMGFESVKENAVGRIVIKPEKR